jgi:hypothetical protein
VVHLCGAVWGVTKGGVPCFIDASVAPLLACNKLNTLFFSFSNPALEGTPPFVFVRAYRVLKIQILYVLINN